MAEVVGAIVKMLVEELDRNSANSEQVQTKIGANINALIDSRLKRQIFTNSGSWTAPDFVVGNIVFLLGCGGGGGGGGGTGSSSLNPSEQGGGGGGGTIQTWRAVTISPSTTYSIVIGIGGAGGPGGQTQSANGAPGTVGGTTSFGNLAFWPGGAPGFGGRKVFNTTVRFGKGVNGGGDGGQVSFSNSDGDLIWLPTSAWGQAGSNGNGARAGGGGGGGVGPGGNGGNEPASPGSNGLNGSDGFIGSGGGGGSAGRQNSPTVRIGGNGGTGGGGILEIFWFGRDS
jgi:hypothetical protein